MPGSSLSFPSFLSTVPCFVLPSSPASLPMLLPKREHICCLCFIAPLTEITSNQTQCFAALSNIAANTAASQCLAVNALIPVVTAAQGNSSLIPPLNNWLGSMCGAPACSNDTLAAVVTNLTSGCSTYLNISSDPTSLIPKVQSLYPTVRKILCLKQYVQNLFDPDILLNILAVTHYVSLRLLPTLRPSLDHSH